MKSSNYTITHELTPEFCADLITAIEALTDNYYPQITQGWRNLIRINEINNTGDRHSIFTLNTESDIAGGEYADVKLAMLENFPKLAYTGEEDAVKLAQLMQKTYDSDPIINGICDHLYSAEKTARVNPEIWETLRKSITALHIGTAAFVSSCPEESSRMCQAVLLKQSLTKS